MGQPGWLQRSSGEIIGVHKPPERKIDRHPCAGFPTPGGCLVIVPGDTIWCTSCRTTRQAAIAAGIPESGFLPIGIVLEDFDAPRPMCRCGGDATAVHHLQTLTHIVWAWRNQPNVSYPGLSR